MVKRFDWKFELLTALWWLPTAAVGMYISDSFFSGGVVAIVCSQIDAAAREIWDGEW